MSKGLDNNLLKKMRRRSRTLKPTKNNSTFGHKLSSFKKKHLEETKDHTKPHFDHLQPGCVILIKRPLKQYWLANREKKKEKNSAIEVMGP